MRTEIRPLPLGEGRGEGAEKMIHACPSPNYGDRRLSVSMLVLHYTGMVSAEAALQRLCHPESGVSCHYLIDEDGTVYRLVEEGYRAWHAGAGFWQGITDINSASIGIELVNPGHEGGYRAFPPAQIAALVPLAEDITRRYALHPSRIAGHSDVAPTRKKDPGELFPWESLAAHGIGLWPPGGLAPAAGDYTAALQGIGYDTRDAEAAHTAFQRRFLPWELGTAPTGEAVARARWLAGQGA